MHPGTPLAISKVSGGKEAMKKRNKPVEKRKRLNWFGKKLKVLSL